MRNYRDESCPAPTSEETRRQAGARALLALVGLLALLILGAWIGIAQAQTVTRNVQLSWTAPTKCVDGTALATNCPISGYGVLKLIGTTWTQIGTTLPTVTSYTDANVPIGVYSYRVVAKSTASTDSNPSNLVTKNVNAPDAGDIVITVTVTVTTTAVTVSP
jgi:hypothetical protein